MQSRWCIVLRRRLRSKWLVFLLLSLLVPVILLSAIKVSGFLKEPVNNSSLIDASSNGNLFRFVWDKAVGMKGGYYVVSDNVFPLKVYVLNLSGVGNYHFSNHSDLIDGVISAVQINSGQSEVKEFKFNLEPWGEVVAKLNVNVSCVMVEDWTTYRRVIESDSNAIVVDTYDEFLPVPDGYLKEAWADRIADFMLNRWGTWVHAGGYPFYRVWFQNGTQSVWGEAGFQRLMSHIGKGNATCYSRNAEGVYPPATVESDFTYGFKLIPDYWAEYCLPGNPLLYDDFGDLDLFPLFTSGFVSGGAFHAAIRFSPNTTSFNFGVYVHLGTWKFRDYYGESKRPAAFAGFLGTAVAILQDYSSLKKLYGREGNSASEAILRAQSEGRTIGLPGALTLFQNALDAYSKGEYKMADSYATNAIATAQNAITPTAATLPVTVSIFAMAIFGSGAGAYYCGSRKKKTKSDD
jgi:hypothetical protein